MRRILTLLLILAVLFACSACNGKEEQQETSESDESYLAYASFYPIYALTSMITDGIPGIDLHQLIQPQDGCLRNYSLSDWDLTVVANSDIVIVGNRGLESFSGILEALGDNGPVVVSAMISLDLLGQDDEVSDEDQEHFYGANPWLFLSAQGASEMLMAIGGSMAVLDEQYADDYYDNLDAAVSVLSGIHEDITEMAQPIANTDVAVLHEGLVYPASEMGLSVKVKYERESGTVLSDNELSILKERLNANEVKVVLIEEQAPASFVKALKEDGFTVVGVNTFSTGREEFGTEYYLNGLKTNAERIVKAINEENGH